MLTLPLSLCSTAITPTPTQLVTLISQQLGSVARVCWLHNEGRDVIGLFPKWFIRTMQPNTQVWTDSRTWSAINQHTLSSLQYQATQQFGETKQTSLQLNCHALAVMQQCITQYIDHHYSQSHNAQHHAQSIPAKHQKKHPQDFRSGLMGFIGYDIAADAVTDSHLPLTAHAADHCPSSGIGHYDIYLTRQDTHWLLHYTDESTDLALVIKSHIERAIDHGQSQTAKDDANDLSDNDHTENCQLYHLSAYWDESEYTAAFGRIQNYLKAGDCYQVNLAQHLTANYQGNPATLLETLHTATHAPYAGYMEIGDYAIISCSPELFLSFDDNGCVTTKPIKGTLPRLTDPVEDAAQIERLKTSEKNQAENLMIVDLLRNDLSMHATIGSVSVPKLFAIESFAQVHHMVSTITAKLQDDISSWDMLLAASPGGSITGAPKIRAIEIIHELEKQARGAYCGSMGFMNFDGSGEWNILIRTLQFWQGKMSLWAGGGITIASDCADEYQECMDKISGILAALEDYVVTLDEHEDDDFADEPVKY